MVHTKLKIEGMHCGSCAAGIQMILASIDGVKNVTISHDSKEGDIDFDDTKVQASDLAKSIGDLGYQATVLE